MEIDQFLKDLKIKFYNKNTWLKPRGSIMEQSVLDTIKAYLLKKNLVLISKSELETLKNNNES